MEARARQEMMAVMTEIVGWLRGERTPSHTLPIPLMIDPRDFDVLDRGGEINDDELVAKATMLRSEALRVARELAGKVAVSTSLEGNVLAGIVNNLTSYASALEDSLRRETRIEVVGIDEEPTRFRFRKADRVAWKREDGSPDAANSGVIVDGIWKGQVGGGWYQVIYEIQRSDGMRVRARPLELVKLPQEQAS
jgi:hypothetical protein